MNPALEWRKPFDVIVKGLSVSRNGVDRRWTFPNEISGRTVLLRVVVQRIDFTGDALLEVARLCPLGVIKG